MLRFVLRRLVGAILVLIAVSFITFALLDVLPGDMAERLAGEEAAPEQVAALRRALGLDEPLPVRYLRFAGAALLHGDLGRSLLSGRQVSTMLGERFAATLGLTLVAMGLAVVLGLALGLAAATRPGGIFDTAVMSMVALGQALPTYWVALLLILVFALRLRWLPVVGAATPAHMVLPAISLALPAAAVVARLVRASLLDARDADYVRTAYAKGLAARMVWQRHIMRNSLVPVVTMVGLQLGHLLGGAFIVETIFAWPGLGRLLVQAIFDRDPPVVVGAVLLIAVIVQILNVAVDVAHAWLDPRVSHAAM